MLQSSAIFVRTASSSETVLYLPAKFKEDRVSVLHDAIRQAGIATLVTLGPDGLIASHLPMMIDPEPAPYGTLIGHFSRGNPQWRDILRSEEHTSELQSLMRISYAVFCLKKKNTKHI